MRKAVVLNDEPVEFSYNEDSKQLFVYKGNCLVEFKANIEKDRAELYIKHFKDFKYIFISLTKTENTLFEDTYDKVDIKNDESLSNFINLYGIHPKDVIIHDDTQVTSNFIKNVIPHVKIVSRRSAYSLADINRNKLNGQYIYSFKQFTGKTRKPVTTDVGIIYDYRNCFNNPETAGLIVHEDVLSSWKGLMMANHYPKYGLIVKYYPGSNNYSFALKIDLENIT